MSSSFKPAVRAGVGLLVGIAGPTGSGKTFTALKLARGLADDDDSAIAYIDTEAGRALHYAAAKGEAPTATTFGFSHASLTAPFTPERYLALIEEADRAGFKVIVIDSFSHEWDGEGGLMELHDEIHERMGGQDKQSIAAWKEPKLRHKRLVSRLLQCRAHLVICMRAEDKLRMEQVKEEGSNGREYTKTKITAAKDLPIAERWAPICEKRFPYELITSIVLTPDKPGVAVPLKLQEQHRAAVLNGGKPIDENVGRALAAWARGATPPGARPATSTTAASNAICAAAPVGAVESPQTAPTHASDDGFPGDFVEYAGQRFDPMKPGPLDAPLAIAEMETHEAKAWATALSELIKRAPSYAKRAWYDRNTPEILQLKARGPAMAARLEELASEQNSAVSPPADGDAAVPVGGADADGDRVAASSSGAP